MTNRILNENTPIQFTLPASVKENYTLPDPSLLQVYEDRSNRILLMLGEVSEDVGYDWVDFILRCNREDEEQQIPVEARKPIKCIISNKGGSVDVANTLIDVIQLSKTPVWSIAIGTCASAASMIFLAAHRKFALSRAVFLFHLGSCQNLSGSYAEIAAFMEDYKHDIENLTDFYKEHTRYTPEVIEQKLALGDWYIRVPEALQNGVIDEVVTDLNILL